MLRNFVHAETLEAFRIFFSNLLVGNEMEATQISPDLLKSGRALPGVLARAVQSAWLVVLWLALALPVAAQTPGLQTSKTLPPAEQVADPLGRNTPRGTITGLSWRCSAMILSLPRGICRSAGRSAEHEKLALDLNELMDRYVSIPVTAISAFTEGAFDDGLPLNRERVGPLAIGEKRLDIALVRVDDP